MLSLWGHSGAILQALSETCLLVCSAAFTLPPDAPNYRQVPAWLGERLENNSNFKKWSLSVFWWILIRMTLPGGLPAYLVNVGFLMWKASTAASDWLFFWTAGEAERWRLGGKWRKERRGCHPETLRVRVRIERSLLLSLLFHPPGYNFLSKTTEHQVIMNVNNIYLVLWAQEMLQFAFTATRWNEIILPVQLALFRQGNIVINTTIICWKS